MIDREHDLPLTRQSQLLGISRGSVYYLPKPVSNEDLALMRRMDELHLDFPFAGSRMLRDLLNREGFVVGRKRVRRLMKKMGIEALYRKPNTSKPGKGYTIYPYRLRGITIDKPNQVWAMDITYEPMAKGFVYLCAVVDWASRKILAHRISISMDGKGCWRESLPREHSECIGYNVFVRESGEASSTKRLCATNAVRLI